MRSRRGGRWLLVVFPCVLAAWLVLRYGPLLRRFAPQGTFRIVRGYFGVASDRGLIPLPEEERAGFLDRAMTLPPAEFAPLVEGRMKEIRKANREGKEKTEEVVAEETESTSKEPKQPEVAETEDKDAVKVVGKIDLASINQKTRPDKKSKKQKEEEKKVQKETKKEKEKLAAKAEPKV